MFRICRHISLRRIHHPRYTRLRVCRKQCRCSNRYGRCFELHYGRQIAPYLCRFVRRRRCSQWRNIAKTHGASGIKTRVHTSSGNIDLNIEYKGPDRTSISKLWMLRSILILVASWSYHQLHLLESDRYPSPTEWFA